MNMHWSKRKKYKEWIEWLIFEKTTERKLLEKATITFDIYFKVNRRRDKQNYLGGGLISWLDAIVNLHIIKDDNADCIGQPIVNFYVDKNNPRTIITIEKV